MDVILGAVVVALAILVAARMVAIAIMKKTMVNIESLKITSSNPEELGKKLESLRQGGCGDES